ncbi:SpoVR family protein [Parahaliea aestuarii]|uniref:SpoVR family protein n=1 Tax=Parahaliea aestuarii TaxID=1852021 RepID=A0A5C8ZRF0_9GAMM|nr:SpoVR family protein [Parahaliea aestuarii]TXS91058.1 SpoVR family protein [Parahaliea aestuarii]
MAEPLKREPLSTGSDWTFELLQDYEREIARIAGNFGLDTYPNQIEIISSEQMMDAYASAAMPINYHHWSFGKHFLGVQNNYKRGRMGLAYEIVFNSNPCIAYLMEENTLTMQALVIAHASYGHNSFFKNNYLFRTWTDAESIIDYMLFARNYIAECEQRHGIDAVEDVLDACHALMNHGVDRYKRPYPLSVEEERLKREEREAILQQQVNELWKTLPVTETEAQQQEHRFPEEPQENILYFLEKNAPLLEPWQREIIRIVRKVSQYLYPQRQTKVMNEGWACFWHFHILHEMYREGLVNDGFMMEFLQYHTAVVYQPPFNSPYYSGINPYTLGYGMMQELRRISESPTDEDRRWFPDIAGTPWQETMDFAMRNFKDESFILQFLSPRLIRELKLFAVVDDQEKDYLEVSAIHDDAGYQKVRESLSANYDLGNIEPYIQVYNVNVRGDRTLTLRHEMHRGRPLEQGSAEEVVRHLQQLWGFEVILESVSGGEVKSRIVHSELGAGA